MIHGMKCACVMCGHAGASLVYNAAGSCQAYESFGRQQCGLE